MKKLRILGIAPYDGLSQSMTAVAKQFDEIELTAYTGNLEEGASIAEQLMSDYDVIITRGGTATLIKEFAKIPVIEIEISTFDILRTIRLSHGISNNLVMLAFPNIARATRIICELSDIDIKIIEIDNEKDAKEALVSLDSNINYILCDVFSKDMSGRLGFSPILLTSGKESVLKAIQTALLIARYSQNTLNKAVLFENMLDMQESGNIICKSTGNMLFSSNNIDNLPAILSYLNQNTENIRCGVREFHLIGDYLYSIIKKVIESNHETFYLYNIGVNIVSINNIKHGMKLYTYDEVYNFYSQSFFSLTSSARLNNDIIHKYANITSPVMIIGESGTGKNQVAAKLHLDSGSAGAYISIDCTLVNAKSWNYIMRHYNSPLFSNNNTIFLANIHCLGDTRANELLSCILDTNAHKRNKLIFSCSKKTDFYKEDVFKNFINYLPCQTISLSPLRELTDDISSSSHLYLNSLNIRADREVFGIDDDAVKKLEEFKWPENFNQLKRILEKLVSTTSAPYIHAEDVERILSEEAASITDISHDNFDYDRPLDDIIKDVIQHVLANNEGNQTKAAKALGIGRTTLWRYLRSVN